MNIALGMPSESIGSCGTAAWPDRDRLMFELELGIALLRLICGGEPSGCTLQVVWNDHELGEYGTVGLVWAAGSLGTPEREYVARCERTLTALNEAVDWDRLWEVHLELVGASAHPLMLLVAESDGTLKKEFEDFEAKLPLSAVQLIPEWWPHVVEGQELSPDERAGDFEANLEACVGVILPQERRAASVRVSELLREDGLLPQRVVRSLLYLRGMMDEGPFPAQD